MIGNSQSTKTDRNIFGEDEIRRKFKMIDCCSKLFWKVTEVDSIESGGHFGEAGKSQSEYLLEQKKYKVYFPKKLTSHLKLY